MIHRSDKNGGPLLIDPPEARTDPGARWRSLEAAFGQEILHPGDLKPAVEEALTSQGPDSLQNRLIHTLPPWTELMVQMDAAFPLPRQNGEKGAKTKPKKPPASVNNLTSGDRAASGKGWFVLHSCSL